LEEENHLLRTELENLKEIVNQLTLEINCLKNSMGISTKSSEKMSYRDVLSPQEPQMIPITSQTPRNVAKSKEKQQTSTPTSKPTLQRLSTVSNGFNGQMKPKISELKKVKRTVTFADVVASSTDATSSTVSSGPPSLPDLSPVTTPRPSVTVEEWTQVKPKSKAKSPSKKPAPPSKTLRSCLDRASSKEEMLKVLLRVLKPPEERSSEVVIICAKLPLTKKAQLQPMLAWKQALKTLVGHLPLTISLINPCKAELFYDTKHAPEAIAALKEMDSLIEDPPELTERDLGRRKQAYLNGYFLPLRRAALTGFSFELQQKVLSLSLECLRTKFPDKLTQQQWKHQIAKDQEWIEPVVGEMEA
jgi:hypothetical protein